MGEPFDLIEIRRIALEAAADPRSVLRELREPGSVRKMAGDRIRRVLARTKAGPDAPTREQA